MNNLPDDWGNYYYTCDRCGGTAHASGTVECGCVECPKCDHGWMAPGEVMCEECESREEAADEEDWDEHPVVSW